MNEQIQHFIETAIRQQRPGFRAGFISSIALKELMFEKDIVPEPRDINLVLRSIRYVPHLQLCGGYVRKNLMKTSQPLYLYAAMGSPAYNIGSAEDVVRIYLQTNT